MSVRFAVLYVSVAALGCSTSDRSGAGGVSDASADSRARREDVRVKITLPPFFERDVDDNGFGEKRLLADVEVCVVRSRPHNGAWEDFAVVTDVPCVTVPEGMTPVLTNVPGLAEIVVTAKKADYRPVALAVITGEWDSDLSAFKNRQMDYWWKNSLVRLEAPWPHVDPDVPISKDDGDLYFAVYSCGAEQCISHPGVQVSIESSTGLPAGSGPHYWYRGKVVRGATGTIASEWSYDRDHLAGTSFVNLPQGEYALVLPQVEGGYWHMSGRGSVDASHGYPRREGLLARILAPVLRGHSTIALGANCYCDNSSGYFVDDAGTCAPRSDASNR